MSQRTLAPLFNPSSVAVIGASSNPKRAGHVVIRNLIANRFSGPIMPVTQKYQAVMGILTYPAIEALPIKPDIAIICTRASRVPAIVETLAQFGCQAAIVMASGMHDTLTDDGHNALELTLENAKRYGMRLLGPNSLGMMVPAIGLNASLAHTSALPGKIAFLSQSAALCTTVLDWANNKSIGFSAFVSLGDAADIRFGEMLDYLGRDANTRAILLYIDSIKNSRRFLSAARAASRHKPIIVVKSGRSREGRLAANKHTGGTMGSDSVYEAAFRRAGMLRVQELTELFAAVETLAHSIPVKGENLAILSNGGGPAVLAVDELVARGGKLGTLSQATKIKLDKVLPAGWSGQNPVDIIGDADALRYGAVLDILLDAPEFDAVLVQHSPSALGDGSAIAQEVIRVSDKHKQGRMLNILTNWSGEDAAYEARRLFSSASIPTYRTPESAAGAFMYMVEFRRNQKLLQQVPESVTKTQYPCTTKVHSRLEAATTRGRLQLETHEAAALLSAYGINTIATEFAANAQQAIAAAKKLGYPVALKIQSPDLIYKSDVQGVMLNITTDDELCQAANAMLSRVHQTVPGVRIEGMLVQKMALTAGAQEIRVAVIHDPVFGPAICLGEGGSEWDPTRDAAVALPPLNMALARYMVIQALKTHKLKDRHLPQGLNMKAICLLLTRLSDLLIDCPQVATLDLNPVLAAGEHITVLDINLTLHAKPLDNAARLAIMPYPKELEETARIKDGRQITLRPILPEDEPKHHEFDSSLSAEDRYKRYFGVRAPMTHEEMVVLTQIDYAREMAFIATETNEQGVEKTLGAIRATIDPDNTDAEFAMAVRSDHQGLGIGRLLLEKLIRYYRQNGTATISGYTMFENRNMASLAKSLGFTVSFDMEEQLIYMHMPL